MNKTKVLFLCTGNSSRSQMAEALLRKYAGDKYDVYSAGLEPKGINPFTQQVMQEVGISLKGHHSKHVSEYMGKLHFGYLITVCSDAEEKCPATFPGISNRLHWSLEDPAAVNGSDDEKLNKFREVRDQIDKQIKRWLTEQSSTTN
ncbi:MAG: low molecular weight phosphatase family protein [Deltaproteobacteria bacterium HGW-Deltaproteobacteria-12]|nr:MAG: low molecular weight phosphatase family protein [Deltaproteobacteria bacterium HGW-Deltaproteobacteria-12]